MSLIQMCRLNDDNVDKYGSFFLTNFVFYNTYRKTYLSIFIRRMTQETLCKLEIGNANDLVFDIQTTILYTQLYLYMTIYE